MENGTSCANVPLQRRVLGESEIMRRREFFSFAAAGATLAPQVATAMPNLADVLSDIEKAVKADLPGVSRVEISYRPGDNKMPLMIFAYRD